MKLICLQENIKEGLFILERIASKNQNLPLLNNIILKTEKGLLKTFATDLEIGVEINIPCKVEKEGEVVVPVKTISQFISNLPNTKITIEENNNNKITIEADGIKTTIPISNKEEFPIIPKVKKENTIKINPNVLKNGITQVLNSVAISHPIQEILGVLFVVKDGFLKIISTDSFRLSEKTIYQKNNYTTTLNQTFILPQKTAQELVRIINQEEDVEMRIEPNQILFSLKNINIVSRLISGNYPNYEQIIPKKTDSAALIDKNELILKTKLASLFSSKINDIKIILNPDKKTLELKSADQYKGEFSTTINTEIKGDGFEVVFNYKYVLDGLANISDENIIFEALDIFSDKNVDYVDAVLYSINKIYKQQVITFDKKLNKLIKI